ncbi:MAG: hypothetical protein F2563_03585 [Actinobacteria bacterium]|uniref:Unannotated protein n=1 Tax=freshwater metagenome TaxID=449393 RepID=A0A6J6ERC3_9ZZZZ|nr:hypothetical protein [Actinomycetota bacterium]
MTKQEIIERCIAAYSEAIEVCGKLEFDKALNWLDKKELDFGVCHFVLKRLGLRIDYKDWVDRHEGSDNYWAIIPRYCDTHDELIQSLQTRIEILKKELSIPEQNETATKNPRT